MSKFRKRPVVVDAIQWTGENVDEVLHFAMNTGDNPLWGDDFQIDTNKKEVIIKTLEGVMRGGLNWWIICGVRGEFYPCDPDVFESTYEPVTGEVSDT